MRKRSPHASAEQLRRFAKKVCKHTLKVNYGDRCDSEGYIVNAQALEELSDFVNRLPRFYQKNWPK